MTSRRPSRKQIRSLCAEAGPDDGLDPRLAARHAGTSRPRLNRKARQLCGQVADMLNLALADLGDDVLRGLYVVSAVPAPDESRLLVTVGSLTRGPVDPVRVVERLERASGRLRSEVASAITRRKAPALAFRYAVPGG